MLKICKEYIETFLPKTNTKRKYSTNEITYVISAIKKIFAKYANQSITDNQIIESFEELGYNRMYSNYDVDYDVKKEYIRPNGSIKIRSRINGEIIEIFHLNVSAPKLKLLNRTLSKLPPNTGEKKRQEVAKAASELTDFFKRKKIRSNKD